MPDAAITYPLALITLLLVVLWGGWQLFRVRQAKKHDTHSALADHPGGTPVSREAETKL